MTPGQPRGKYNAHVFDALWREEIDRFQERHGSLTDPQRECLSKLLAHRDLFHYLVNSIHSIRLSDWSLHSTMSEPEPGDLEALGDIASSLVYVRLNELQPLAKRLITLTGAAAYHTVVREFRFILDAMVLAYWADTQAHEDSISAFEAIEAHGENPAPFERRLTATGLNRIKPIRELHSELSNYVHPSREELHRMMLDGETEARIFRQHIPEMIDKTVELAGRTTDAAIYIGLCRFGDVVDNFRQKDTVQTVLNRGSFPLTKERLREHR